MTRLIPARELERLKALSDLDILDTAPERQFDAICHQAAVSFDVRIAYIAFIDAGRQWLKAACGMPLSSVPRGETFCSSTILFDRAMVVRDATEDPRFKSNIYVLGPPYIRFYAGVPLTLAPDLRIGTFCLIDTVARDFSDDDTWSLRAFAEDVVERLRSRARAAGAAAKVAL